MESHEHGKCLALFVFTDSLLGTERVTMNIA